MQVSDPVAFFPAPVSQLGAELGRTAAADVLATLPEILRRSRLGVYLTDDEVTHETGLSRRQLRHLRDSRRLAFCKQGRTIRYRTADVFAFLDAGFVPVRGDVPLETP